MRVLVIGGSGFLSGTVARVAVARADVVDVVTRGRRPVSGDVRAIVADRNESDVFAAALATVGPWDIVVDCIGFSAAHARQDLSCFVGRASHLVFISTDSVFDPADRPWRIDETFDRFDDRTDYARGKRAAERALLEAAADAAVRGTLVTILRPGHIFGPGSLLGCLPDHARDERLLDRLREGEPLRLVGSGYFLQQPTFAADLAEMALSCAGNPRVGGEVYMAAGPDVVACRDYYRFVANALGVAMPPIVEVPIAEADPSRRQFYCHRVYATDKARAHGLTMPATPIAVGLAAHVRSLVEAGR